MTRIDPTPKPSIASQEFRDGAASGGGALAWRARRVAAWGITLTPELLDRMAEELAREMGGAVYPIGARPFGGE